MNGCCVVAWDSSISCSSISGEFLVLPCFFLWGVASPLWCSSAVLSVG